jgi:pentatricopeptide repeat protein
LEEIKGYYDSGIESCRPDAISFNAKLRTIAFKRGKGRYDEEALAMYEEMKGFGVMPNSETFELLIKIFTGSRAKNSASIADNFLRQGVAMFPPQKGGIGIDSFNAVLYSWVSDYLF